MRRGAEVRSDARCCVKVATRRPLEEQLVVVAVLVVRILCTILCGVRVA